MRIKALLLLILISFLFFSFPPEHDSTNNRKAHKIQVAILLDVSNSMDGLIDQAKTQLWKTVNLLGKAKCQDNYQPEIEIALYEYGRSNNRVDAGYVKQITGFTADMDLLSKKLFSLKTMGGNEYCGHVIYTSVLDLKWDDNKYSYKTIFIAGNEDFLQGNITYTKACAEAMSKGIIVNTIYCGDKQQGIREHWNLGAECGNGSYSNINQNEKTPDIPTPYDPLLFTLNDSLNKTYVYYGNEGKNKYEDQAAIDNFNSQSSKTAALERVSAKANKRLYKNSQWDLVDAEQTTPGILQNIDAKLLPAEYRSKTKKQLEDLIRHKQSERSRIQNEIQSINTKREAFIDIEKNKVKGTATTLETAMEKTIREQARRFRMIIN